MVETLPHGVFSPCFFSILKWIEIPSWAAILSIIDVKGITEKVRKDGMRNPTAVTNDSFLCGMVSYRRSCTRRKIHMRIAVVVDKPRAQVLNNEEALLEDKIKKSTASHVEAVLKKKYDTIIMINDRDIGERLRNENIDFVFNLSNGIKGESRLSQLPAMLENEGIPYTGSGPIPHGIAYNKIFSGKIFKASDIPTPGFISVRKVEELNHLDLTFPLLVKPKDEGSSRGIKDDSLVYNVEDLRRKVEENLECYNPPVMISEYIEGREYTVGILGNHENLRVLPIMEIDLSGLPKDMNKIYSFEAKFQFEDYVIYHLPARIDEEMKARIEETAKKAFHSLGLRDYSRVDIRVKDGIPHVIEINSLPGLNREISDIVKMAEAEGTSYEELVLCILDIAMSRTVCIPKEDIEANIHELI